MTACSGLACDNRPKPGRCCTGLGLGGFAWGKHPLEALIAAATVVTANFGDQAVDAESIVGGDMRNIQIGLPFLPFHRLENGHWRWWCFNLTPAGRCGDYENRPALCHTFQPASDPLCAMFVPRPDANVYEKEAA
jgi:Fe-S-cluster containining protein